MKKNRLGILYCGTYFLICLGFAGCQGGGNTKLAEVTEYTQESKMGNAEYVGSTVSGPALGDRNKIFAENISLDGLKPFQFAYSSADNKLGMIVREGRNYSLHILGVGHAWEYVTSWKCEKNQILDTFRYGSDGTLYCMCKEYEKGKDFKPSFLVRQNLVQCKKNGALKIIWLKNLGIKEVCDIQFSGTAFSLTCADRSVKFYNIREKQGLGDDTLRGESGINVFCEYHYFTEKRDSAGKCLLTDYDIRTGEKVKTFVLGSSDVKNEQIRVCNYHKNLFLLTPDGLYGGAYEDIVLPKMAGLEELGISREDEISFFQVARDDILYFVREDKQSGGQLVKADLSELNKAEKNKDSVFIMAKL